MLTFGYCTQLFREGSEQGAVNAGMQVHFKLQQRRTGLSRKRPLGEQLLVSLSHTTKRQHALISK